MLKAATRYVRSNAVAFLALFVALGGTATATHLAVNGSDVVDESLSGADIEGSAATDVDGTLKGEDVQDGSLNTRELAVGAVNSARVEDGSIVGADVETGSLSWGDLDLYTRNAFFVRTHPLSTTMLVNQQFGTTGIGENDIVGSLHERLNNSSGAEGWAKVLCTDSGFAVVYENIEAGTAPGHQRVWTDNGSSVRYRTLPPDGSLTAVSSGGTVPEAKHVTIRVHSINENMDAAIDVMVTRTPQGRGDPCLWHATTIGSHEADLD